MDFPHMDDNQFPYIDTVKPYQFVNDFDYSRWNNSYITLKMLNVKWDNSLVNVPYFKNDTERNGWFTAKQGHVIQLQSKFMITPESTVKVPVPYNEAYLFNYLMVTMTNANETYSLDYGSGPGTPVGRWFFFIVDMKQLSPSTTELYIQLDYWTTFINSVNIPYMVLERGHAPLALTDVDTYLADPINNNEYLLAKDFDFGNDSRVVKSSSYFPVGNGKKWVLFALPITSTDFGNLYVATGTGSTTLPTYADETSGGETTRWGEDLIVNDYEWNFGNAQSYANADLPIANIYTNDNNTMNGHNVLAIEASSAIAFFTYIATNAAYIMNAISSVFVVGEDCLHLGTTYTWHGFSLRQAQRFATSAALTLSKAAFGFDTKYAGLAKLYTYPYSSIEITDNYGNTSEVRVENISSSLKFHKECEIAFPYIQYRCFFTGINGNGTLNYTWQELNDVSVTKDIWEDDFSRFMFTWDIPTYVLRANAALDYAVSNHSTINAKRQAAIFEYQTADRYANTTEANIHDSQTTMKENTQRTAATDKNNTYRLSDTTVVNMGRENERDSRITGDDETLVANSAYLPTGNGGIEPALLRQNYVIERDYMRDLNYIGEQKAKNVMDANNTMSWVEASITADNLRTSFSSSMIQSVCGGIGGGSYGSALSMAGGIIGTGMNFSNGVTNNQTRLNAQVDYNQAIKDADYKGINNPSPETIVNLSDGYMLNDVRNRNLRNMKQYQTDQSVMIIETNERNDCKETTTKNLYDTTSSPLGTIPQNALDTKTTIDTNSADTCTTETTNADWTRDATWQAANANLVLRQLQAQAPYNDARLQKPKQYTDYSGNAYPDVWENRGVQWKIRTQSKSAIAQAGDGMLRYGYTVHRVWDISDKDFCKMDNFTFWKAEDIWITNNDKTADRVVDVLSRAFLDGLTVWNNPDDIGSVSIYENNPLSIETEEEGNG